jgi:mannan endo-1,4-beta-mannosidase
MLASDEAFGGSASRSVDGLPWIRAAGDGAPYFVDETGAPWTPIGQNDALTWPEFSGLFGRRDLPAVERHLLWLKASGVTVLRLHAGILPPRRRLPREARRHLRPAWCRPGTTSWPCAAASACACC